MVSAIKVQFIKEIFEDDFVERGMTAWLTAIDYDDRAECYKLYFDFTEFESINDKYFREMYYPNRHTAKLNCKELYTAKEAGIYKPKYWVYFNTIPLSVNTEIRNDSLFPDQIAKYLQEVL